MTSAGGARQRYQAARRIFLQLWDEDPSERAQRAVILCGSDADLLREVQALLANADADTSELLPGALDTSPPAALQPLITGSSKAPRFEPGQRLAERFVLRAPLGRGGMGEVWQALDETLGAEVALKFLHRSGAGALDFRRRADLLAETRAARQVTHPQVCRVHDLIESEGECFLSMEYVPGRDLRAQLRHRGRMNAEASRRFAKEICGGLDAIHAAGLLHRDLKPANVLLDRDGRAKLSDFGLAVSPAATRGGESPSGTQAYMAPEVLGGGVPSARSDIFSLGLVLYEVACNRRAFQSGQEILRRAARGEQPPSPSQLVPDADPIVDRVVRRCLVPDPEDRPVSAALLLEALQERDPLDALRILGESPSAEIVAVSSAQGLLGRRGAVKTLIAFFILLGLILATARGLQTSSPGPSSSPEQMAAVATGLLTQLGGARALQHPQRYSYGVDEDRESPPALLRSTQGRAWRLALRAGEEHRACFWLREGRSVLALTHWATTLFGDGRTTLLDPPASHSGIRSVVLASDGRLLAFQSSTDPLASEPGYSGDPLTKAFDLARLQRSLARPCSPILVGSGGSQLAWEIPGRTALRVEAELFEGQLRAFYVIRKDEAALARVQATGESQLAGFVQFGLIVLLLAVAIPLALRHFTSAEGDNRSATLLAVFCGSLTTLSWWMLAQYPAQSLARSLLYPVIGVAQGLGVGATIWLFYMATEPLARRQWPRAMVASGRLLRGRIADPLVLSHILLGCCFGLVLPLFGLAARAVAGLPPAGIQHQALLSGSPYWVLLASLLDMPSGIVVLALEFLAAITFLSWVLRSRRVAAILLGVLCIGVSAVDAQQPVELLQACVVVPLMLAVLLRLGILAFACAVATSMLLFSLPPAHDGSDWHASASLLSVLLISVVALATGLPLLRGCR